MLVAEALRTRGRLLLESTQLNLEIATEALEEGEHELSRRASAIAERRALPSGRAQELFIEAWDLIRRNVDLAQPAIYGSRLEEARERLWRDATDAPTLALALALDCGIWTADRDFFGCSVAVWSTETLLWWTRRAQSP